MNRPGRAARTRWLLGALAPAAAVLAAGPAGAAPAIVQAAVLDLTVLEVQVIVAGVKGSDEVRCLVRDPGGRVRLAARGQVASGTTSGPQAVLSLMLPLLHPGEQEFAISLRRGDAAVARTAWRPLFR